MITNKLSLSSPEVKVLNTLSAGYLLLPNMLFLLGWVHWGIAIPLVLTMSYIWWKYVRETKNSANQRKSLWLLCGILFIGLLFGCFIADSLGLLGHAKQSVDFAVRTTIYDELVAKDWPLYAPNGDYFIYYHAYWLPPAFMAKIASGLLHAYTWLFLWVALGISLAFASLWSRFRHKGILLFIMLLFADYLLSWAGASRAFDKIPCLQFLSKYFSVFQTGDCMNYFSIWESLGIYSFNSAISCFLILCMIVAKLIPVRFLLFFSAMIVLVSPLAAAALFILLIFQLLQQMKNQEGKFCIRWSLLLNGYTLTACIVLVCAGLYFATQDGSNMRFIWSDYERFRGEANDVSFRIMKMFLIMLFMLVPAFIIIRGKHRKNAYFLSSVVLAVILPLIWVGRWNNEFLYKGSIVLFFNLTYLYYLKLLRLRSIKRICLIVYLLLIAAPCIGDICMRVLPSYTWDTQKMKENIRRKPLNVFYNPQDLYYANFFSKNQPCLIFYRSPGESVSFFSIPKTSYQNTPQQ